MFAEQKGKTLCVHKERTVMTRLGKGMEKTGKLSRQAIRTTLKVLQEGVTEAESFKAERIIGIGTSALRTAENREAFLKEAKKLLGKHLFIVSGRLEGELVFRAMKSYKRWKKGKLLGFDLGGGSIEIVEGNGSQLHACRSLRLGTVRVKETLLGKQPMRESLLEQAQNLLKKKLKNLEKSFDWGIPDVVASGGAMFALCGISQDMPYGSDITKIDGYRLTQRKMRELTKLLSEMSVPEIQKRWNVPVKRSDIVLAGALVYSVLMEQFGVKQVACSLRGARHGAWDKWLANEPYERVVYL